LIRINSGPKILRTCFLNWIFIAPTKNLFLNFCASEKDFDLSKDRNPDGALFGITKIKNLSVHFQEK